MSDSNQSGKSRGTGRIAQLLAHARLESEGLAPSLDNPTRPKTPAGFDDKVTDSRMNILQMKTKATSRSKALVNSTLLHKQLRENMEKNVSQKLKTTNTNKSSNIKSSIPLTRILDTTFNSKRLLNDLNEIEIEFDNITIEHILQMLDEQILEFIKFLNTMKSDTELESEMTSEIEDIVLKFSKIALLALARDKPEQVFTLLRLNLRILVPLLVISSEEGAFDLGLTSMVLKQCTQALLQLYRDYTNNTTTNTNNHNIEHNHLQVQLPTSTSKEDIIAQNNDYSNNSDIYQDLDDCDIEVEDYQGNYVSQLSASSKRTSSSINHSIEICNNCELIGATQLLTLLNTIWRSVYKQIQLYNINKTVVDIHDHLNIIQALLDSAYHIISIVRRITMNEIDAKRLNSTGILKVLVKGLKFYHIPVIQSYIKTVVTTLQIAEDDVDYSDTVWYQCLAEILLILRNYSIIKSCKQQLFEYNIIPLLCMLLRSYKTNSMVIVNCTRVLAKLSLYERVREQINANTEHVACLVNVVVYEANLMCGGSSNGSYSSSETEDAAEEGTVWPGEYTWTILTRVCFTLGNLTTTNVENRQLIGKQLGLTEHIVLLLQVCAESLNRITHRKNDTDGGEGYSGEEEGGSRENSPAQGEQLVHDRYNSVDRSFEAEGSGGRGRAEDEEEDSRSGEREFLDATVKLVRLLANLSIDVEIGSALGSRLDSLEMLYNLLVACAEEESASHEELVLNVIAACTNITYFSCQFINQHQSVTTTGASTAANTTAVANSKPQFTKLAQRMLDISRLMSNQLTNSLFSMNAEIQLEAARVLGNLTRTAAIRQELISHRIDEVLVQLLKHDDWDIVAAVTGVLVNLSADAQCKEALLKPSSQLLVAFSWTLRKVGLEYPELSTLICQALYNLLLGSSRGGNGGEGTAGSNTHAIYDRIQRTLTELTHTIQMTELDAVDELENQSQLDAFAKVATAVLHILSSV